MRVSDVHRSFEQVQAVRGVSFDVAEGEFLVLLGPSGSGKTTLLRLIAGFEAPTRGEVEIRGRKMDNVPPNRRGIGVVFQHLALFPHLTVFRNVAFGLEVRAVGRDELRRRVAEALWMVRLVGFDDRMPRQLSGGQQQRVALARALVTRPAVLLMDEPLGSLDPHLRTEMQVEVRQLQQSLGITAIMVTHDQEEAMTMGDRIAVLHDGKLEQIGTPRDIYAAPASTFVARFIGAANVLGLVQVRNGGTCVEVQGGLVLAVANPHDSADAAVIRPEDIRIARHEPTLENAFRAKVLAVTYLGASIRYRLALENGTELSAVSANAAEPAAVGDQVWAEWPARATLLVGRR